jgi:hypothetical protein
VSTRLTKAKKSLAIALLATATLAPSLAEAAAANHHRHSQTATDRGKWVSHYAPAYFERHDVAPPPVESEGGHGILEEHIGAP